MSKSRFKLYAEVDTLAHANTIKNSIQNQLAGLDIFESHNLYTISDNGKNQIVAEWRFNSAVDRDALVSWAQDQIQNNPQVKVWTQKAKLSWHRCTHDEAIVQPCNATDYFEWIK